jgi:hypothetical protein
MSSADCLFCKHHNPAGAKFCNACGSPLHLTPCTGCGAVNNLAEMHCWRCGAVLLPLHSPQPGAPLEREPDATATLLARPQREPDATATMLAQPHGDPDATATMLARPQREQDIERELVALEQEVRDLGGSPKPIATSAQPPVHERDFSRRSAPPVLNDVVAGPRRRSSGVFVLTIAAVGVLGLGIVVGMYLYKLGEPYSASRVPAWLAAPFQSLAPTARVGSAVERAAPPAGHAPSAPPPPLDPATPGVPSAAEDTLDPPAAAAGADTGRPPAAAPRPSLQGAAPPEPRVVREIREAVAALPAQAGEPRPKALDAPMEREFARGGESAAGAAATPEPRCPPAVEAMALCEWLAGAKRQ